jgi:hypothetical protein
MTRPRFSMPEEVATQLQVQLIAELAEQGGLAIGRSLRFVEPHRDGVGWMLWVGLQTGESVELRSLSHHPSWTDGILVLPVHSPDAWRAWLALLTTPGALRWRRRSGQGEEAPAEDSEADEEA